MAAILDKLATAQQTLDAVRTRPNHNDHETELEAYRNVGELFHHGLQDPLCDERDEFDSHEEFVDHWLDHLGAEATEPGAEWTDEDKGLCWKVLGDLNFLHSHDAGLNAAMRCYAQAFEYREAVEPEVVVAALARMLRAGTFASYPSSWFGENLDALRWGFEHLDEVSQAARFEFQMSYVDMARRAASLPLLLERPAHETKLETLREIFEVGRDAFVELCDDELPYRKSFGWLAAGVFVSPRVGLSDAEVAPLVEKMGADGRAEAQRVAIEAVERVEDGLFYPHGGVLACNSYIDEAKRGVAYLELDAASQQDDAEAILSIEARLVAEHPDFRRHFQLVHLAETVAALLEQREDFAALEAHVTKMVARFEAACEEEGFYSHLQYDDYFKKRLEFAQAHELDELADALEQARNSDAELVKKREARDADIKARAEGLLSALFGKKE